MAVQRDRPYAQYNFLVDLGTGDADAPDAMEQLTLACERMEME